MKALIRQLSFFLIAVSLLIFFRGYSWSCVGRTIYIGYFPGEPEQVVMAKLLTVFIDERTGTSVKLVKLDSREKAFDFLRKDKVSILVDYAGNLLSVYKEKKGKEVPLSRFPEMKHEVAGWLKAVIVTSPGFDSSLYGRNTNLGKAIILLSRKALSRFPAMPRLLKKLRGVVSNGDMKTLIEGAKVKKPEKVTRSFLKKNKLI